ncbi:MAG: EEP domain-containing protein [Gammaproteobacteria bacterium]|nr:MAG: EEP domain-containing protein [Gammaproteobacteria bacterium]
MEQVIGDRNKLEKKFGVVEQAALLPGFQRLSLVSYNIQAGIHSSRYHHYLTNSWQHLLPTRKKRENLERIAGLLRTFDVVGLQEVDSGGSRSEFIDQTEYLAYHAGFPYWSNQINRRLGRLALHSNGLLSRLKPHSIHDYKLPGLPGRGALLIRFGENEAPFYLCILHLALGRNARKKQLGFVSELIRGLPRVIVMGDLNCEIDSPEMKLLLKQGCLVDPLQDLKTYPSWNPRRKLDHLLVTPDLRTENVRAINFPGSDHLPVAMDIFVPVTHKKGVA